VSWAFVVIPGRAEGARPESSRQHSVLDSGLAGFAAPRKDAFRVMDQR
jgi:hypothetical protein